MTIYGSLVPWRSEWYWSGEQISVTQFTNEELTESVNQHRQNTKIVGRFWPEREKLARERMNEEFQSKLKHYGTDFIALPDGPAFEREEVQRMSADMKARGFTGELPRYEIFDKLLDFKTCLGIYFDSVEGTEFMEHFDIIISGLKKNGKNCTPEEEDMLRIWLDEQAISPGFIYRALKEYGGEESLKKAVFLETTASCWLDYLLRCRKGDYYRHRFPALGIV